MKRLAIIPVKTFSRRLKRKNFIKLDKKSLYSHTLDNLVKTKKFSTIHISSEKMLNEKYQDFLRPRSLTKNNTTLDELIIWILNKYRAKGVIFDTVCLAYATSPLLNAKDYLLALKKFENSNKKNPLISCSKFRNSFDEALILKKKLLVPVNHRKFYSDSKFHKEFFFETGAFIFFSSDIYKSKRIKLIKNKRFLPYILPFEKSIDLNTKEDFKIIKKLYNLK